MPMDNFGLAGSQGIVQTSGNLEQQQLRPQLHPVSWKAKTPTAYDQSVPPPSMQVQPIHAARQNTPHQAQVEQGSLSTPTITPRWKAKKGPAGKSAQVGAPSAAPVAPDNGEQIGQPPFRSPYVQQQTQAPGLQNGILQQQTPFHQREWGQEQPPQGTVYGEAYQQPLTQSPHVPQQNQGTSFQNGHLQQTPFHPQLRGPEHHHQGPAFGQPSQQASGGQSGHLQQRTALQQAWDQQRPPQQPVYAQQPPIGMYAPPKIAPPKPPGTRARSPQQQIPGAAKSRENIAKTVPDGPQSPVPRPSYEPFPQSIQSKWLARSWKHLTLPKLDVLPGITVQTRLAIGAEHELVIPAFVLQMRGLDAQGRLEAWMKITKLGRSFYALFPKDPRWKDVWGEILQFSQEMIKQERSFYRFVEKIDPAEKKRLFEERAMHVRVDPALINPWNPQWTDPELSEFARQKPFAGSPENPIYVSGSTTNQQGDHPGNPYAQDSSRVSSANGAQAVPGGPPASTPFQSPLVQEQSTSRPAKIAKPPQAQNHAQDIPRAGQTPRLINPVPAVLGPLAPVRKRKPRANKKDLASKKKVQTNQGQGDKLQQEMAPWLKDLEKRYLANRAEIDAYYMDNNDLGTRNLNDDFADKMRMWNGRKPSTFAPQQISDAVQQGSTSWAPFPEAESARPVQYTAEEEMIAEGAAQAYIADLKRGTVLPLTPSQVQGGTVPPLAQYAAPQAQMFSANISVQSAPGTMATQSFAAQGQVESLQTPLEVRTSDLQQPIGTPVQQIQQQLTQEIPTPAKDVSPEESQASPPSQPVPPPVNAVPQAAPQEQKKPSSVFNPTQEAQKTVYRQMLARNAALHKRLELPEAERIVVGGIDIAALLDAGTDMMKIIKQITPFMTDPALVVEQPISETQPPDDDLVENDILPAVPPTFIHAPEHGWNNVEIIDETDIRFWPGLENISDDYWAGVTRNAFAGETRDERKAWEDHVAAEYQREMEKLDGIFGKDTYFIGDW